MYVLDGWVGWEALRHWDCWEWELLVNFLDGIGVEVDPNMSDHPRESSYVRMDGWDEEAIKWFEDKRDQSLAAAG